MSGSSIGIDGDVVARNVTAALAEDIGSGDITAELLSDSARGEARLITRAPGILCGRPWADAVFRAVDERIDGHWHFADGDVLSPGDEILRLTGPVRGLLTAERTAMNFLQTLSGTATRCSRYAAAVAGTPVRILDTRKTLPGLREAQKYAVRCGGCHNHRMGLYDAFLIKENHILACGGIHAACCAPARQRRGKPVEVEVENLDELAQAVDAAPSASCWTTSISTVCARPCASPAGASSSKPRATSPSTRCGRSPRPASISSPSAH
jgi:nicotinate-nucleotide pyrophosphorylase (carboxylating)